VTGIDNDPVQTVLPRALELRQNFPNPFNPQTTITFSLPHTAYVNLSIYDAGGRLVRALVDEETLAGEHALIWNGRDRKGKTVASGVYFMRLTVAGQARTQKIVLLK
jgi:flagellar hook assembly protein FlgD